MNTKNIQLHSPLEITEKKSYLLFLSVLTSTIATLAFASVLIARIYKPDIAHILTSVSSEYLNFLIPSLLPKPVERLQFVLCSILSVAAVPGFYYLFKSALHSLSDRLTNTFYAACSLSAAGLLFAFTYIGLSMSDFVYVRDSFFFDGYGTFLFTLIIFPTILYVLLLRRDFLRKLNRPITLTLLTVITLSLSIVFLTNIHSLGSAIAEPHFNAVFYPVTQAIAGKMLLVNLTSLYGLFPVFLVPIFKVIDPNILNFSIVMGLITCAAYIFILKFMKQAISTPLILYSGFLSIVFYSNLAHGTETMATYFQYWPIRLIFPALFLYYTSKYMLTEKRNAYIASLVVSSLSVLWNFDTGVFVFLGWIAILTFHECAKTGPLLRRVYKSARHAITSTVSLFLTLAIFTLYTYIQSGSLPDFSQFLIYQKLFLSGFLMIPLPPPLHVWALILLTYLSGLIISVSALAAGRVTHTDKLILLLSILGVGLFSYYEGRSHDLTLFGPSYPAIILAAIYAEKLYVRITKSTFVLHGEMLVFTLLLFTITAAPFSIIYNMGTYAKNVQQVFESYRSRNTSSYAKNIDFIKSTTEPGEGIFVMARHKDGIYYGETGTYSLIDIPSSTDISFKKETVRMAEFLSANTDGEVFLEQPINSYDIYDPLITKILEEKYFIASTSESNLVLLKRKNVR